MYISLPSVLWRCWLGSRKGIWPVKNRVVGCWCGCLSGARCRLAYHMAQLMPLPLTVSCYSKIQIGSTFLVLAHLGSPWKRAVKRVCVCVSCTPAVWQLWLNEYPFAFPYFPFCIVSHCLSPPKIRLEIPGERCKNKYSFHADSQVIQVHSLTL